MGIAFILVHALGLVIGSAVATIFMIVRSGHGTLHIDHYPEKDFYRFEIDRVDNLSKKKQFIMKINHNNDLPQK
jgi:hypothetical protein